MKRIIVACALALAAVALPAAAATPDVRLTQAPPASLQMGESLDVTASAPTSGERYLLTLTMVDLESGTNVDLEGWIPGSAGLAVPSSAGESTATWNGKAGKAGRYRVYVTAVPLDHPGPVTSSAPTELTVSAAPALHAGPLVVVAAGEPVLVALAIGWVLLRRRGSARKES